MADVKIKMVRPCFVKGQLFSLHKIYDVDEKTGSYLMQSGKAVPADTQTKKGSNERIIPGT